MLQAVRNMRNNNQSPRRLGSVYPQAINYPIGLAERGREIVDKVNAGARPGDAARLEPNGASPITTERQVEYYPLSVEMRAVVTITWEHWENSLLALPKRCLETPPVPFVHPGISRVG